MKTKKQIFGLFYLLFFLTLCSCATPIPIIRLSADEVPENAKRFWFGAEQVFLEHEGVKVVVTFVESTPLDLIFSVEVINTSGKEILIAPEKIYYQAFQVVDSVKHRLAPQYHLARNPEEEILNIDKEKSITEAQAQNSAGFNTVVTLVQVADDIGSSVSKNDTRQAQDERNQDMQNQEEYYQSQKNGYLNETQSLNQMREYWANNTLRKTHLPNGNSIEGTVLIPRNDKANYLKFVIPIEKINFVVDYKQNVIKPKNGSW